LLLLSNLSSFSFTLFFSIPLGRRVRDDTTQLTTSYLAVSGSRGIGGVTGEESNIIDLFDLEEDEDDDDSSDEE
jgi:hypothetical protein